MLFENRNQPLQPRSGQVGSHGVDLDPRTGIDVQRGNRAVGGSIVADVFERDLGFQPVFLLVEGAYSVQTPAHAALRHRLPRVNQESPESCRRYDSGGIEFEIALQHRLSEASAAAAVDLEEDVDLAGLRVVEHRVNAGKKQAVA